MAGELQSPSSKEIVLVGPGAQTARSTTAGSAPGSATAWPAGLESASRRELRGLLESLHAQGDISAQQVRPGLLLTLGRGDRHTPAQRCRTHAMSVHAPSLVAAQDHPTAHFAVSAQAVLAQKLSADLDLGQLAPDLVAAALLVVLARAEGRRVEAAAACRAVRAACGSGGYGGVLLLVRRLEEHWQVRPWAGKPPVCMAVLQRCCCCSRRAWLQSLQGGRAQNCLLFWRRNAFFWCLPDKPQSRPLSTITNTS